MSKYEPLGQFLRQQDAQYVPMRFAEIEKVLGMKLPASSKEHRAWWSNNPSNNVMTRQWLEAGYETEAVDLVAEKLVFRRVRRPKSPTGGASTGLVSLANGVSKYKALGDFLKRQIAERVSMSFDDIEDVIGSKLPDSKFYAAWWSNNPGNNTMTKQWLDAGYRTEAVNVDNMTLVFRKVTKEMVGAQQQTIEENLPDHPIWGSMAGTITVKPGVDLTEPMEFEWGGKLYNE